MLGLRGWTVLGGVLLTLSVAVLGCTHSGPQPAEDDDPRVAQWEEPASSQAILESPGDHQEPCDAEDTANRWLEARPLVQAATALRTALDAVERAAPGQRLTGIRDLSRSLSHLTSELEAPAPKGLLPRPSTLPLARCLPAQAELALLYRDRLSDSGFLELLDGVWHLTPELSRLSDVLRNFLELELLRAPAPESCLLPQVHSGYEWSSVSLRRARSELVGAPSAVLRHLRASVTDAKDGATAASLKALPGAACEQLSNLVCHHLKRARVTQAKPKGLSSLRRRARSMASAEASLRKLRRRSEQLGCGGDGFGLGEVRAYARRLIQDATGVFLDLERVRVGWLLSRNEAGPSRKADKALSVEALNYLRVSRLETAALAMVVVEPALTYLKTLNEPLSPTQLQWQELLSDLPLASTGKKGRAKYTDLARYEDFLAVLLKRPAEVCELARSTFALNAFPPEGGLHARLGGMLGKAIRSRCETHVHG